MSLIYITGVSGTGKSTIKTELLARGHEAHDTDEGPFREWQNIKSGEFIAGLNLTWDEASDDFKSQHTMAIKPEEVEKLQGRANQKTIFLCGSVPNIDDVYKYFETVVCLVIDDETLRARLASRTSNTFGRRPSELEDILRWNQTSENDYKSRGAMIIDATQPLNQVVDELLESINE